MLPKRTSDGISDQASGRNHPVIKNNTKQQKENQLTMKNWINLSTKKEILKNKMDEFRMLTKKNKNDGDDNVNIDVVQGRGEVEFEETNPMNIHMKISKKDALASYTTKNIVQLGHSERWPRC